MNLALGQFIDKPLGRGVELDLLDTDLGGTHCARDK